jgi:hypothetical protein
MWFNDKMPNLIPPKTLMTVETTPSPSPSPPLYPRPVYLAPYIANQSLKPLTAQNSSSVAKKVTDDLFASTAFYGSNPAHKEKYCSFLKDQLNKCVTKKEDCLHIKNMYDEVCSSLILTKPA